MLQPRKKYGKEEKKLKINARKILKPRINPKKMLKLRERKLKLK